MSIAFCIATLVAMMAPVTLSLPTPLLRVKSEPHVTWAFQTGGEIGASGALSSDGKVFYVGSRDSNVYALNADTGAVIWKYKTGGPVDSGIVLNRGSSDVDEQLFFGSDDGYVYAIDAVNGTINWKFLTGAAVTASPLLGRDMLYVGSTDNKMYAICTSNQAAGTVRWTFNTTVPIAATAAFSLDMNTLYFQSDALYALDVASGIMLWSALGPAISNQVPPLVGPDSTIYATIASYLTPPVAAVYGRGPNMGKIKFMISVNSGGMALGADGSLYVTDLNTNSLKAYYTYGPYAGKMDWSYYTAASTSPILVNTTLIAGTWDNALYGVCAKVSCASQFQWSLQLPAGASSHLFSAGIASADGSRLFVGSLDYSVYCVALT